MLKSHMAMLFNTLPIAFMSEVLPTVTIKTANGPVRINKHEFNPKQHELHDEQETPVAPQPGLASADNAAPTSFGGQQSAPQEQPELTPEMIAFRKRVSETNFGVVQSGTKFIVVNSADGSSITDMPGIEAAGYKSMKKAWEAVFTLKTSVGISDE